MRLRGQFVFTPQGCDSYAISISMNLARRRAAGIKAVLRDPFADDVAVGHHADQPIVLSNRNGAYVMLTHQFCEFGERSVRADPVDSLVHHVFDFHAL
jgi:hypothetical protein